MLVADDDPCVLRAIADRCTLMGFEVETATNGLKTLIKASRYNPDILVVDVHMPFGLRLSAGYREAVAPFDGDDGTPR